MKYRDDVVIAYKYDTLIIARYRDIIVNEWIMLNNAYRGDSR